MTDPSSAVSLILARFRQSERGNVAIITALLAVPLIGLSGLALDFSRAQAARTAMQGEADSIAMAIAVEGPEIAANPYFDPMAAAAKNNVALADASFSGRWISVTDYEVVATATLPLTLAAVIPGAGRSVPVETRSVARFQGFQLVYKQPEVTLLDPEAGDYNRVYAYCFDKERKSDPQTLGRGPQVAIADNGGSTHEFEMPQCKVGETLSFRLYNVRWARGNKDAWDDARQERYDYFTDTIRDGDGRETYDLGGWAILETVLCPTLEKCVGKSKGGVIPEGRNRTPERSNLKCQEGMFTYYGWEDRPPGRGDSDRDYDDIRVIIECPRVDRTGFQAVKLVR